MRFLLIDTCGETGSLALAEEGVVLRERTLLPRAASAHLVAAIREELEALQWPLRTLDAVCVVNGPGSFTGVRVGLAAAKGLCEVAGVALVTLSRLEVLLATAGGAADVAALDAGRGELYARWAEGRGEELLLTRDELLQRAAGMQLVVVEDKVLLAMESLRPRKVELPAANALVIAEVRLRKGSDSVEAADANYVRSARALYASVAAMAEPR